MLSVGSNPLMLGLEFDDLLNDLGVPAEDMYTSLDDYNFFANLEPDENVSNNNVTYHNY